MRQSDLQDLWVGVLLTSFAEQSNSVWSQSAALSPPWLACYFAHVPTCMAVGLHGDFQVTALTQDSGLKVQCGSFLCALLCSQGGEGQDNCGLN